MNDKLYDTINKSSVINLIEKSKLPVYESKLIKLAFPDLKISISNSFELYRCHFVLFNFLYFLQDDYMKKNKYLHIHFMGIHLLDYPKDKCRFYDVNKNNFCNVSTIEYYCDFHREQIGKTKIEKLSEKYFYLDKNNLNLLDKDTADAFIKGAFGLLKNYDKYKRSLKVLNLSQTADISDVRKRFYMLAKRTHPDIGGNDINKFIEINNAYQFLIKILPDIGVKNGKTI